MTTLNRNNSNWSAEERRKINENWDTLEGIANSAANGNNGLKQEVDALKITASNNTQRVTQSLQIANQANNTASSLQMTATEASRKSDIAINSANNANRTANGIDAKATQANERAANALSSAQTANNAASNAAGIANRANTTAENVRNQLNQVVAEAGSNNPEVVASRADTETGENFNSLPERLDSQNKNVVDRITAVERNPNFLTSRIESTTLGPELIGNATFAIGTGWTGDAINGFTHTAGNTQRLIVRLPFISGQTYEVGLQITNPAVNDNGQSDYYLSLAGSPEFETYKGRISSVTWGIKAIEGSELIIRPWEGFNGKLIISIKQVSGVIQPYNTFRDSNNAVVLEQRFSKLSQQSLYLGLNAGRFSNAFSEQNTVLGNNSMRSNTSGFWNTAVGYATLQENTVGSRNVAIGRIALQNNISGTRNIGLGPFALRDNTTGINNIGIGADAIYKNISGEGNIGIGTVTLGSINDAEFNIAIGDRSMSSAPGGNNNVALGRRGLYVNAGNNNVAFGEYSLFRNTTGSNNFASGNNSAYRNTTGSNNVAIGLEALYTNATSSGNVAIGANAMRDSTSGNSIAIGSNALRYATANNNIALGVSSSLNNITGQDNVSLGINSLTGNTAGEGNVTLGYAAAGKANANRDAVTMNRNVVIGKNAGVAMGDGSNLNVLIGSSAGSNLTTGERNIIIGQGAFAPNAVSSDYLNIGGVIRSQMTTGLIELQKLRLTQLPTTAPTGTGMIWNDGGTLKIT